MVGIQSFRSKAFANVRDRIRKASMNPRIRPKMEAMLSRLIPLTPKEATVEGSHMFLARDRICLQMALSGTWEPRNTTLVRKVVRKGETVVDIGAHVGYFTLILSKLVGDGGRVYAFEPDPDNFALLRLNVETNGCSNVILDRRAVSDGSRSAFLGGWTLMDSANSSSADETKPVDTIALDDLFGSNGPRLAFVKIDVEGHEIQALRGAAETLRRSRDVKILTEFDVFRWSKGGVNPREYLHFLSQQGFEIRIVNPAGSEMELVKDFDDMLNRYNKMGLSLDLFCTRTGMS